MFDSLLKTGYWLDRGFPEEILQAFQEQKNTIGEMRISQLVGVVKISQVITSVQPILMCIDAWTNVRECIWLGSLIRSNEFPRSPGVLEDSRLEGLIFGPRSKRALLGEWQAYL